jgi:hypothetical protein
VINQADQNDEKVLQSETTQMASDLVQMLVSRKLSPYDNPSFCEFLYSLIETHLFSQTAVIEQAINSGGKSKQGPKRS